MQLEFFSNYRRGKTIILQSQKKGEKKKKDSSCLQEKS